jgi:hypothetical protein
LYVSQIMLIYDQRKTELPLLIQKNIIFNEKFSECVEHSKAIHN